MKLKKRGKIWWIDYYVDGKRHRQSTKTPNKAAALEFAERLNAASKMPTFEDAVAVLRIMYGQQTRATLPVSGAWEIYTNLARATGKDAIAPTTMERRRCQVERFVRWIQRERPAIRSIEGVSGPVAIDYARHLADAGLKTKTRANAIGELGTVWRLLEKASDGVKNPWGELMPRDIDGQRGKAFSPDEEARVVDAARRVGKDWLPVCVLMRHTGLRYGDVARLQWSEIQGDVIRLSPVKTKRHGITVALPITAPVADALASVERRGEYVFPIHAHFYGNRGRASREALCFREVLEAAGLGDAGFTIHSWRHTAATRLAEAGAGVEVRQRILGHRTVENAERYDHDEHLAEVRAAMEAAANRQ